MLVSLKYVCVCVCYITHIRLHWKLFEQLALGIASGLGMGAHVYFTSALVPHLSWTRADPVHVSTVSARLCCVSPVVWDALFPWCLPSPTLKIISSLLHRSLVLRGGL